MKFNASERYDIQAQDQNGGLRENEREREGEKHESKDSGSCTTVIEMVTAAMVVKQQQRYIKENTFKWTGNI